MTQRHCCTYPSIASPHTLSPSHVTITERHNHKTSTYHSTSASEYVTITLLFDHNTSPSHKVAVTITMVFVRRKATSTTSVIQGLWKLDLSLVRRWLTRPVRARKVLQQYGQMSGTVSRFGLSVRH